MYTSYILTFVLLFTVASVLAISPYNGGDQSPPYQIDNFNHGDVHHNCIHDKLEKLHFSEKPRLQSNHHLRSSNEVLPTHPIRTVFNTTFLGQNADVQTCYSVGQVVILGNGTSNGKCGPSVPEPCSYTCTAADVLTPDLSNLISSQILTFVSSTFEKYLNVSGRPATNSYSQIFQCIEKYDIDIRNGFTGDFMIYVSAHPTSEPNVIAYATACLQYSDTGAPFLGIINFNPSYFSPFVNETYLQNNLVNWNKFLRVGLHEMTHALGFSSGLYSDFKDPSTGNAYTEPISSVQSTRGTSPSGIAFNVTRYFLNTPTVLKYVEDHFSCEDIPFGAELENIGGSGTAGSHWKASRFGEELMLGFAAPVAPFTGLTLGLLYDSGWYGIIDQENEESTIWGKGKGCSFINDQCTASNWAYSGYWPSTATVTSKSGSVAGCSATRSGRGNAVWGSDGTTLPVSQQHFDDRTVGGNSPAFEYCVFNTPTYYCFDTSLKPTVEGEVYGASSACFVEQNTNGAAYGCRPQRCEGNNLQFQFNNTWFDCLPGTTVTISNSTTIICPDKYDMTCRITSGAVKVSSFIQLSAFVILIVSLLF